VDRIAAPGYEPSPGETTPLARSITAAVPHDRTNTTIVPLADILKARIQTLGVEEHPLRVETGTIGA
jgi:hypothetical protein